ncbi:MAG: type IV pilin protein [Gaiellaceae bacterium]
MTADLQLARTASRVRARVAADGTEGGFSLVELLVVVIIISVLSTVAVGAYLGMRERGERSTAELNVREALSAAEAYYAQRGSYTGLSLAELKAIDAGVRLSREPVIKSNGRQYCLESTHNGRSTSAPVEPGHNTHSLIGPGGEVVAGACPASL